MALKVYTQKEWIPEGLRHTIMLYPYWGEVPVAENDPDKGRFNTWNTLGKGVFSLTTEMSAADVVLLPYEFSFEEKHIAQASHISKMAEEAGKKLLIFYNNDNDAGIPVKNTIVFRTSFYRKTRSPDDHALPGWSADFLEKYCGGELPVRYKPSKPTIGYCGYVDYLNYSDFKAKHGWKKLVKLVFLGKNPETYWFRLRGKAVRQLRRSSRVKTNLVIRNGFWAQGVSDKQAARKEYLDTILCSDYALVVRGEGNFSYRLYEVMSSGRIPVFINTDCILPFEETIDWKSVCVWVEEQEIDEIGKKIRKFHAALSPDQFVEMQQKIRHIYEHYLSPVGFFSHLKLYIQIQ